MSKHKNSTQVVDNNVEQEKNPKTFVFQRPKIDFDLTIRPFPYSQKQIDFINLVEHKDTKLVFLEGPSGVAKTHMAVLCGLKLLNQKRIDTMVFVRSIIESASKSLGFLPGTMEEKLSPFLMPLLDKLEELIPKTQADKLLKDERIKGIPINHLRGASFNVKYICLEESQNFTLQELTTAITRLGNYTRMVVIGDSMQSDVNGKSGFSKMAKLFDNDKSRDEGIFSVKFDKSDIVRSGVLRYIIEQIEELQTSIREEKKAVDKPSPVAPTVDWVPELKIVDSK